MFRKFFIFFSLVLALFFSVDFLSMEAEGAFYTETKKTSSYTRIFYYRQGKNALASLYAHPTSIDVLAPQSYSIDETGTFSGEVSEEVRNFSHKNGIKIMPLVTNKGFSTESLDAFLGDGSKQDIAIEAMIKEAKDKKYWGYQIDFEQINYKDKDKFSAFVKKFHDAMKKESLIASVAVVSKISDNPTDYKNDLWQKLIGAYDYDALGENSDFVSIMSYDDPTSKGPVAGWSWLGQVITYTKLHIPAEKISLGLSLYYWAWDNVHEKIQGIGGYEFMDKVMKKYKTTYVWSKEEHVPRLVYHKGKVRYQMWYENGRSIAEKIDLIKKSGFHGFSAWALGLEVPSVHKAL